MNSQSAIRRTRMEWIAKVLDRIKEAGNKKDFDKNHFIAQIMVKHGISRRIAREDVEAMIEVKW